MSSSSSFKRPAAKPSRAKAPIRVDSSSESDSEEERPFKRARVHSRISKRLAEPRFQVGSSQPAASLADAFNTASVQNSKSIPNTVRHQPPPSASTPAPALPPKKAKQNAVTVSRAELASLPAEGSSRPESSAGIEDKLTAIMAHLNTVVEVQANQAAELSQMRRVYSGHGPEAMADPAVAERQSLATETTVKVVADLVSGLVSALRPQPQPLRTSSSSMSGSVGSSVGGSMGGSSQNWHSPSYRGRGRGRGGGVNLGDHPYRSMPSRDIHSDYRPTRQHHYEHHNAPFPVAARHFDQPVPRGYYERRVWYEGPHAHEERQRYHHPYAVEREQREQREPQEPRRKRRTFTRFSPPNSPENSNSLGLVVSRSRPSYPPNLDGEGSSSEGSGTVTNANDTARNPEAFAGNARAEAGSTAKFFNDLTRPLNTEPDDAQDWEAGYDRDD
ncbi:hypothetical protein DFH08DRAFT_224054 [Mycena albidolilacea]|uniref:Uncharacterized protein n=1 Tax=Mycena albidolilacea TaxID=1033008 RepID=A0AAD6ZYH9_9AGAR|nr:hypothetical protein DFH08DRAFT_224054 [Mycena albidolilacea]